MMEAVLMIWLTAWLKRQQLPRHRLPRLQVHPIEPLLLGSMEEAPEGRFAFQWRRIIIRLRARLLWHVHGICLWLCRRPWLRFTPFPYPSISSIMQWQLQAQQMVSNGAMSRRHHQRALQCQAYTAGNLKEAMWLRDRLGWQTSFVEDPMLQGMLAARSSKGVANKIRQEAVAEAKALAIKAKEEGKELQAVRELIGPKGGLPALKADLQKLASLLHVSFNEKTTVEQLKAGIKPVVQALMAKAPASSMTSSSSGASFQEEPPKPSKAPSLGELCQDLHRRRLRLQSGALGQESKCKMFKNFFRNKINSSRQC